MDLHIDHAASPRPKSNDKRQSYFIPQDDCVIVEELCQANQPRLPNKVSIKEAERQDQNMDAMMEIIRKQGDLEDLHIDHAAALLKQQHPNVDGLQQASMFGSSGTNLLGTASGKFVEIVHIRNHWVTVSNLHCNEADEIYVYDSLYKNFHMRVDDVKHCAQGSFGWVEEIL